MAYQSMLLVKFGILQCLSNNGSNELLMIGIALVKKSAKPTIFGTESYDFFKSRKAW